MNRSAFWTKEAVHGGTVPIFAAQRAILPNALPFPPRKWDCPLRATYHRHRPACPARSDGQPANAASTTHRHRPACPARSDGRPANAASGFTLVELLVTITIITMLAGLVLGGLTMARTAAREMKTRSTVAKIDEVILRMYADYAHRRVPIRTSGLNPRIAAELRLNALRHILRMEMPDRFADITEAPPQHPHPSESGELLVGRPALNMAYQAYISGAGATSPEHQSAECLFMIVSIAHPRALEHFRPDEIGDTNGNGLPEFIDAWGNPICFLRWAPGFTESDIQGPGMPDPFDSHGIEPDSFRLMPLVFSAGPSGQVVTGEGGTSRLSGHGLHFGGRNAVADPYTKNPDAPLPGTPVKRNDDQHPEEHGMLYDNIHNHRLEVR